MLLPYLLFRRFLSSSRYPSNAGTSLKHRLEKVELLQSIFSLSTSISVVVDCISGPCDRGSALIKKNVRLYAAEPNRCTTPDEFVTCADSHGGVKSATIVRSKLDVETHAKPKIPHISDYNNFEFLDNGDIVVWKSYKIGAGKKLRKTWPGDPYLPSLIPVSYHTEGNIHADAANVADYWKQLGQPDAVSSHQRSSSATGSEGDDSNEADAEQEDTEILSSLQAATALFPCPEPGCTRIYQHERTLDTHLETGNHRIRPERISLRDAAIGAYKEQLEGLRLPENMPSISDTLESIVGSTEFASPAEEMGWALRSRRRGSAFDPAVRKYLTEAFEEGESTGRKLDPQTVAKAMRQVFPKELWLKPAQITSFWSRLARLRRQEPLNDLAVDDDDDEFDQGTVGNEEDLQDDPYFNNIEADIHESIDENAANIFESMQSSDP